MCKIKLKFETNYNETKGWFKIKLLFDIYSKKI